MKSYVDGKFAPLAGASFTGDVSVTGNLTVTGETFYANVTNLNVEDNIITLNSNVTGTPSMNAGISINRGSSSNVDLHWYEGEQNWQFTNDGTNYHAITRKYVQTLSTSATSYVVTHNLGTQDVQVTVYDTFSGGFPQEVVTDIYVVNNNAIDVVFAAAPTSGQTYRVVVRG